MDDCLEVDMKRAIMLTKNENNFKFTKDYEIILARLGHRGIGYPLVFMFTKRQTLHLV